MCMYITYSVELHFQVALVKEVEELERKADESSSLDQSTLKSQKLTALFKE